MYVFACDCMLICVVALGEFDLMRRCADRLVPNKRSAFWLESLSDFEHPTLLSK